MDLDQLSPTQRAAVTAFVNCQKAYAAHQDRSKERSDQLLARRNDALRKARDAKVPGTLLASAAELTHGRIYQLAASLGMKPWRWWSSDDTD